MSDKILIVDDDRNICEILEFNLCNEGYQVECAYSAEEALKKLTPHYSLILLDVMMGGISGYKMAEKLRKENNLIPIIFLTAKDTENDMLTGFSVGGDDYISKPFSIKEVIARVKAILKRTKTVEKKEHFTQPGQIIYNNIIIDLEAKELLIDNKRIILTKTEFELLTLLAKNPDKILSREDIIEIVWHETPFITERTVDVHITRLRKKMGKYASVIVNRSGYGYKFDTDEISL
ncbi:MAG: response regulator transcription factor [Bacteroidales bacterium]|jgi:DNA-binding response OmpR family regulator|nr:response regulator transcription factor [Bacteroidales bacterium]